jgi:hypothetical protein
MDNETKGYNSDSKHQSLAGGGELGLDAEVRFSAFNKTAVGKVDTGATTSSLHAEKISVSSDGSKVSFMSPVLSDNIITLPTDGHQEVHSADGGGNHRPVVMLEVEINGVSVGEVEFNLNDRSNMDNKILIGQNILSAGNFKIDVNKDQPSAAQPVDNREKIREAIRVLRDSNVTLTEIMMYIQTEAVQQIQA